MGLENQRFITVIEAVEPNLKNIGVQIPRNALTVITGINGSGKSSLAFDAIYAEGQRRYVESLWSYATTCASCTRISASPPAGNGAGPPRTMNSRAAILSKYPTTGTQSQDAIGRPCNSAMPPRFDSIDPIFYP